MNRIKNSVQLIGNVGGNPRIHIKANGVKMVHLSLATSETYKNSSGEKITDTEWHYLVAEGKLAEFIEKSIFKGTEILIEGKLSSRNFTTATSAKVSRVEIHIRELIILNNKHFDTIVQEDEMEYRTSFGKTLLLQ